jgi:hypothetical protein
MTKLLLKQKLKEERAKIGKGLETFKKEDTVSIGKKNYAGEKG